MGNTAYFHRTMPDSPKGREIERIDDSGQRIVTRATQIESLGERMLRAADTLKLMVDGQVGKGLSLDEVREQGEDVHADLKKAGERYKPSGTALKAYGKVVAEVAPGLNRAAGDCESLWETVRSRAADVDEAEDTPASEDGSTAARESATASATTTLSTAKEEWEEAARRFDGYYDTWDEAYDDAVAGLRDANEDGVKDGFWDDVLPFVEALVTVLEYVGIALVLAALIVGGPLIAALATIVAILTLLGTIILFAKGRKDGKDLGMAIIGVIPFGKFAKLADLGSIASAGSRFPRLSGFRNMMLAGEDFAALRTHLGRIDDLARADWGTGAMHTFDQATAGSRFIQRVISGTPYVWENTTFTRTADTFFGRLLGVGDSATNAGAWDLHWGYRQAQVTAVSVTDWVIDQVSTAQQDATVDSWR
ncbi:hypothetical protein ACFQ58_05735 [Agromyces sp. NPDC056523]|uniref:hypothetical protein n=1 Tax=Agromyces sp. NPDC056523 TaxID=3345850 RepID=UPI003672A223